jgi:hypothetical protein
MWRALLGMSLAVLGPESSPPRAAQPCAAPEFRQFDFWIGKWEVAGGDGSIAGVNEIRSILDGCALLESWRGTSGMSGNSLNAYDAATGQWHQTWIDDRGLLLRLNGAFGDGKMTMSGPGALYGSPAAVILHRITWQETGPRQVRQLWEISRDGGSTWEPLFEGRYRPQRGE